jgi:hypothetical protein
MLRKKMLAAIKGTMSEEEKIAKYIDGLLQAIDKNYLATHVAKFTETNSPGNIGAYDDSQDGFSCGYLCTANSGWHDFDMVTNEVVHF